MNDRLQPSSQTRPLKSGYAILFVCTANICRSPMAAALFRARLQKERPDWQNWRINSAGTWAMDGQSAAPYSQQVMAERGLDISDHRARTVTRGMLARHDLILTMEPGQKEALQVEFPERASRVFMLSEMVGTMDPVKDPYGGPLEGYQKTSDVLDRLFANGIQRIFLLVGAK